MAHCPSTAGHSLCAALEGFSFSAHPWNMCGSLRIPSSLLFSTKFPWVMSSIFSFQLSTRCWLLRNLYFKFRPLFWVPRPYNQLATSHSCLTRSQTISTYWNLLFSKSMTEWLSCWQKHWGIILDYFLFLKSASSNNQSPCPMHFISSMFLEILPSIPNTLV